MRARIKRNDTIMVMAGRERGKTGKVLRIDGARGAAIVEGLNLVKRHKKASGPQSPSGIVEKEAPIHLSNVMVLCGKCEKPSRMGKKILENGQHVRVCRRCGEQLSE